MRFLFGDCELDTERYELRRAGQALTLEPKALKVLTYLVQHPGRVVAKHDLLAAFWPGVATDRYAEYALRNCLTKIRQVIGPAGTPQAIIATVRGFGYRFVAPVTVVAPAPDVSGVRSPALLASSTAPTRAAGHPLLPEQRPLTILRCGLVASARIQRLDPDDFQRLVQGFYQACEATIAPFAGYIAQYDSDELLIYFGYPVTYEDAALRAVRAGLALLEAVPQLPLPGVSVPEGWVAVRLSIHTGVVAVDTPGDPGQGAPAITGGMFSVAKQLHASTAPNTMLLSADTYRLVRDYVVGEACETPHPPGDDAPLTCYRVLGESGVPSRFAVAIARGLTPLVGRTAELALLQERWAQGQEGLGQVVVVSGEPGMGKSRLVQELKAQVAGEAPICLEGHCSPYHIASAWYPVLDLLQRVLGWQEGDPPAARLAKLEQRLQPLRLPLHEVVPLFAALLTLPLPAGRYAPLTGSSDQQRQRTLTLLQALVLGLAERQPVLLIVEDLHWVDPSTLEFLSLLVEQIPMARCLLVLTARPEFAPPWGVRTHVTTLAVSRLRPSQVTILAQHVAGGHHLPAAVCQQIVTQTDGIPLFVEELTKTVLESGLLQADQEADVRVEPLAAVPIPATLQDSLLARLDRLGLGKTVAQLGATIGRQFAYDLLRAVAPLEEATLQEELARLVAAELLYQQGILPQATYRFKHALIKDAAYQSLLTRTRQQYHQQIAQALVERFPDTAEMQPEVLAQHYSAAGLYAEALSSWQQAGQRALDRSAYREAITALERGLDAVSHLPQTRATLEQAIDLRFALRSALNPVYDFGRVLVYLREAEALAETLHDPRRLAACSLFLSRHCSFMGEHSQAIVAGQRALALAVTSGDAVLPALVHNYLGVAYLHQGHYPQAIDCFRETIVSLQGAQRRERFGTAVMPAVSASMWLVWCHAELGTFAVGRALGEEWLRIAEAIDHPTSLLIALWGCGLLALRQGDVPRALPLLERARGICQTVDLPSLFPRIAASLGAAYTLGGRLADAMALLIQPMEQTMATAMIEFQAFCKLSLSEAHLLAGHLEEAHTLAEHTLMLTRQYQERGNEAYALRLLGAIHAQWEAPEGEQAEAYYRQALALAEALGMRPLLAHCHFGLGRFYSQIDRRAPARAALTAAIECYGAMGMPFWLPQAEAALAQVEG